ncbi:hypothetical protein TVAG_404240 [Trichomonas vaginalis G3]|uniref:Uncharacterized protein n=1 Tax=Trichomonas vaginalis (strain ATCC PRA-98 / G3) TaxID=412133 RepID=A2EGH3_TRIV3|nr:hypothetical protein TVAGG3_0675530 [Trichomonas vaginalis G3]EAY08256.1 hypothetical protein TVAG_404240 [Trichomonas vaginalis G3]KAI5507507.1 hypothetical protein TVAGG3_0675530 [Trichomonas vaginalis G3]|eukprot:XP_001320479.1 hypothetical protein [Trichomonas vaginalis G3]
MTDKEYSGYYSYYSDSYGEYYSDDETKSANKTAKKENKDSNNEKSKSNNDSTKSKVQQQQVPNESNNENSLENEHSNYDSKNEAPKSERRISVSFSQEAIDGGVPVKHDNDDLDAWASANSGKSNPYDVEKSSNPEPEDLLPFLSATNPKDPEQKQLPETIPKSKQEINPFLEPEPLQSHYNSIPPRITTHSQDSIQSQYSHENSSQINESQGSNRSILSNPHEDEIESSNQEENPSSPIVKDRGINLSLEREMSDERWMKNIPSQLQTPTIPANKSENRQLESKDKETNFTQSGKTTATNNSLEIQVMGTNDMKVEVSKPPLIIIENEIYPPGEIACDKDRSGTDTSQTNDDNSTSSGATVNSENIWFEFAIPEIPAVDNSLFDNELSTEFDLPKLLAEMKKA